MATQPATTASTTHPGPRRPTREASLRARVICDAVDEVVRQHAKWGQQNHPSVVLKAPPAWASSTAAWTNVTQRDAQGRAWAATIVYGVPAAGEAQELRERRFAEAAGAWADILVEEVAAAIEAGAVGDPQTLQTRLTQLAAVALLWAEDLHCRPGASLQADTAGAGQ
jgi:hypothetical protein